MSCAGSSPQWLRRCVLYAAADAGVHSNGQNGKMDHAAWRATNWYTLLCLLHTGKEPKEKLKVCNRLVVVESL